mmetsp:Transcript_21029/g.53827  ORF Transcript_21029/g.53827 Transcript_21029/m.53827 type:complete len:255 (-) Transcript_21029:1301-2065(-)
MPCLGDAIELEIDHAIAQVDLKAARITHRSRREHHTPRDTAQGLVPRCGCLRRRVPTKGIRRHLEPAALPSKLLAKQPEGLGGASLEQVGTRLPRSPGHGRRGKRDRSCAERRAAPQCVVGIVGTVVTRIIVVLKVNRQSGHTRTHHLCGSRSLLVVLVHAGCCRRRRRWRRHSNSRSRSHHARRLRRGRHGPATHAAAGGRAPLSAIEQPGAATDFFETLGRTHTELGARALGTREIAHRLLLRPACRFAHHL